MPVNPSRWAARFAWSWTRANSTASELRRDHGQIAFVHGVEGVRSVGFDGDDADNRALDDQRDGDRRGGSVDVRSSPPTIAGFAFRTTRPAMP
jgi:hypothetical protein